MKKILLIVLLALGLNFNTNGQRGGNGRRSPQNQNIQGGEQREVKAFKASDVAGIFYYDVKKVIKKIKVKDESLQNTVKKALKDYNFKVKEIAFLNSDKFNDLDEVMKAMRVTNRRQGNRIENNNDDVKKTITNKNEGVRAKIQKMIRPIRNEIRDHEILLNEILENSLTEKQNRKWLKYQKTQKDMLAPKRPERNQNNGQRQRGNSNGQQRRF